MARGQHHGNQHPILSRTTAEKEEDRKGATYLRNLDLFAVLNPPCGDCANLGAAIESGVRYCDGLKLWRWSDERVACTSFREAA